MTTALATFPCCLCSETAVKVTVLRSDRRVGPCLGCGLIRTADVPANYEKLYTEGLRYHGQNSTKVPYVRRYEHDLKVAAERLPQHLRYAAFPGPFRLLDVGCANGAFVAYAKSCGIEAEGIEPNSRMAEWAQRKTGAAISAKWPARAQHDQPYNIVTYHDVIEHLRAPVAELKKARAVMALDGLLVVDTPDAETLDGVGKHHMKPLEHVWFFNEKHARQVATLAGFDVVAVTRPIAGKLVLYAVPHFEGA